MSNMNNRRNKVDRGRLGNIMDDLSEEYRQLEHELSVSKLAKDDYERKLKHQLAEFGSLKHTLDDIESNFSNYVKMKDENDEEIEKRKLIGVKRARDIEEDNMDGSKRRKLENDPDGKGRFAEENKEKTEKTGETKETIETEETSTKEKEKEVRDEDLDDDKDDEEAVKKKKSMGIEAILDSYPDCVKLMPETKRMANPNEMNLPILPHYPSAPTGRFILPDDYSFQPAPYPSNVNGHGLIQPPPGMHHQVKYPHVHGQIPLPPSLGQMSMGHLNHSLPPLPTGLGGNLPTHSNLTIPQLVGTESMLKQEGNDWVVVHTNFDHSGYMKTSGKRIKISLKTSLDHDSVVCSCTFSPDGKMVATGCNRRARVFDTIEGKVYKTFETRYGMNKQPDKEDSYIRSVQFSPDGNYIAAGTEDKCVKIWDYRRGTLKHSLSGHYLDIYSIAFCSDNKHLVSGSGDGKTKVWTINQGRCVHTLGGPGAGKGCSKEGVTSVCVSPDSRHVVTGSLDCQIRVFDLTTGKFLNSFEGHQDSVYAVAFHPDGKLLVSGSLDKSLKIWDIGGGTNSGGHKCINTLTGHRDYVLSVAYSHDGKWLISGSKDRSIQFWDANFYMLQLMLQGHKNSVISVAMNPKANEFATGAGDFRCRVWGY